jgi:hypothetical protein
MQPKLTLLWTALTLGYLVDNWTAKITESLLNHHHATTRAVAGVLDMAGIRLGQTDSDFGVSNVDS